MADIYRAPSQAEKEELDGGDVMETDKKESILDKFRKAVNDAEQSFFKKRLPFCARCAKLDFQSRVETVLTEVHRTSYTANVENLKLTIPDFNPYGEADRFELLKETDAMEPVRALQLGTMERKVKIGINRQFRCKQRGCKITMFISNQELEKQIT